VAMTGPGLVIQLSDSTVAVPPDGSEREYLVSGTDVLTVVEELWLAGAEGIAGYLAFIGGTIVFALAFLSLALLMSTVARRRSTAIGLAVLTWFLLAVIFDTVLFGLFIATGGTFSLAGGTINLPDWFFAAELIVAPPDAFGYFGFTLFSIEQTFGFRVALPWFVSSGTSLLSLATWTAVPLVLALWRFRRLDL